MSYWSCLDRAGPGEKQSVYGVLKGTGGFTDSFQAIGRALSSKVDRKRAGRPANQNLITLVTLGTDPLTAKAFMDNQQLSTAQELYQHYYGKHHAVWLLTEWASILDTAKNANLSRRARMVESEFALRWVTLDMTATYALLQEEPPIPGDLSERLLDVVRFFPSIAKNKEIENQRARSQQLDADLDAAGWATDLITEFANQFRSMGQHRSTEYEKILATRLGGYSRGFQVYPSVKPDLIVDEYTPCAVTRAASDSPKAIEEALRRTCHAIEFTAHLQADMKGLVEYVLSKVERYAEMLESV